MHINFNNQILEFVRGWASYWSESDIEQVDLVSRELVVFTGLDLREAMFRTNDRNLHHPERNKGPFGIALSTWR